ncbi:hypothetical protein [Reichenbachiella ulvae]|uniref:Outer membrane protein beta-barrel domain-containing protein n=1 Tax=Reichenbachiella ulvae TaxID=2980104 RepID=A0ABT3CSG5_9BACT|nr:hypothetical protein [Reichenbachiella ulvae]MCV9386415.1 hypothetical protein [Reichenbachiella ulvae]
MKNVKLKILMGLLCLSQLTWANTGTDKGDTVVVEFGKGSKMVIIADNQEELKKLEQIDVNQIISDLNVNLDSADSTTQEIVIEDESGEKFKKDSTDTKDDGLVYYGETESSDADWESKEYDSDDDNDWDDFDFDFFSNDEEKRTKRSFEMDFGMNNWIENGKFPDSNGELYTVKPWGSWYVALGHTNSTHISGPLRLNWGANVSWYNWKLQNTDVIISKGPTATEFTELNNPDINGTKSKLTAAYINLNLVPMLDFGYKENKNDVGPFKKFSKQGFRIGAGVYTGYKVASWTKFVYKEDGNKRKDKDSSDYYINNFRYGVRVRAGYRGMDVFANYDLNNVFADGRGPDLNGFSFGIIL